MTGQEQLSLKLIAGFLDYPGTTTFMERWEMRYSLAVEYCPALVPVLDGWRQTGFSQLEEMYVASFDLVESGSLYLTAHEFGDSRERGNALAQLGQMVTDAGYGVAFGELPDYLPLLIEFLAIGPGEAVGTLAPRIATVAGQILQTLEEHHPYRPLFALLRRVLGVAENPVDSGAKERPDLTELPYPIEYF